MIKLLLIAYWRIEMMLIRHVILLLINGYFIQLQVLKLADVLING